MELNPCGPWVSNCADCAGFCAAVTLFVPIYRIFPTTKKPRDPRLSARGWLDKAIEVGAPGSPATISGSPTAEYRKRQVRLAGGPGFRAWTGEVVVRTHSIRIACGISVAQPCEAGARSTVSTATNGSGVVADPCPLGVARRHLVCPECCKNLVPDTPRPQSNTAREPRQAPLPPGRARRSQM